MRNLLMKLAFLALLLMPVQAVAEAGSGPSIQAVPIMYSAIPGQRNVEEGSLLQRVRGGYCRECRLDCVDDRNDCYDYETERRCRRQFSSCMKRCWRRYCR